MTVGEVMLDRLFRQSDDFASTAPGLLLANTSIEYC